MPVPAPVPVPVPTFLHVCRVTATAISFRRESPAGDQHREARQSSSRVAEARQTPCRCTTNMRRHLRALLSIMSLASQAASLTVPPGHRLLLQRQRRLLDDVALRASSVTSVEREEDFGWLDWASENGLSAPKLQVYVPSKDERGKGGVFAAVPIAAMEVIARIPQSLIVTPSAACAAVTATVEEPSWAAELTAATLMAMHSESTVGGTAAAKKQWIESWSSGGWATDSADLGREDVRWGPSDVTGSLLATGSDNDKKCDNGSRTRCYSTRSELTLLLPSARFADIDAAVPTLKLLRLTLTARRD